MPPATPTPLFDNVAGSLLTHPAGYAIVRYHAGALQVPDLQALLTHLGAALLRHGWYKVLADTRALPQLSETVKEWTRTHWESGQLPRPPVLVQATLLPANVFARLGIAQLQLGADAGYDIRNFPDEAAAHAFLTGLPAAPPAT